MTLQSRLLSNQGRLLSLLGEGLPFYPSSVDRKLLPLDHRLRRAQSSRPAA
jgi:hypothetical protein